MTYKINKACVGCGCCIDFCPVDAISEGKVYHISANDCVGCGTCSKQCPIEVIVLTCNCSVLKMLGI